jgi:hypothetical protein
MIIFACLFAGCANVPQETRADCYDDYGRANEWQGLAQCYEAVEKKKAREWETPDTVLFASYVVATALDARTTSFIGRYGFVEGNPVVAHVIGDQPAASDVWQATAAVVLTNYLIGKYLLPKGWRRAYYGGWALGHGLAFKHNCDQYRDRGFSCLQDGTAHH